MNWTKEQQRAIELRNKNILVAAAAGSGKTAVLVERIKRLILEDRCPIDRMLIVTFTNAAAAEMKEKIELPKADNFCQELAIWQNEHNNVVGKIRHIYPEDLDFYNRFMMSKPVKMHLITIPKEKETIVHKGTITDNDRYLKDLISENEWHIDL